MIASSRHVKALCSYELAGKLSGLATWLAEPESGNSTNKYGKKATLCGLGQAAHSRDARRRRECVFSTWKAMKTIAMILNSLDSMYCIIIIMQLQVMIGSFRPPPQMFLDKKLGRGRERGY